MTLTPTDEEVERFQQVGLPVVLVDAQHSEMSSVYVDDLYGGYLATRHLIDLGHRRIGFISDYLENSMGFITMEKRFVGYYQALEEAEITFSPQYHRQGRPGRGAARKMTHDLLRLPEPPTAIFAHSDMQAIGAIEAVQECGLTVPDDISIVGYDDIDAAAFLRLTTIRQLLFESGETGARLLLDQLSNGKPAAVPEKIQLPVELVVRATTAPPAGS
jgi:DNA-binding LacI/PurR family transcriptional regulator